MTGDVAELQSQLDSLKIEKAKYNEHLQRQHENFGLQSSITDEYSERLEKSENEASLLAEGLQEAEEKLKWLQKENKLIIQQIEKKYEGTINDWAQEILGAKNLGRDESYWRQKADDAEELSRNFQNRIHEMESAAMPRQEYKSGNGTTTNGSLHTNGLFNHSVSNDNVQVRLNAFVARPNPGSNQLRMTSQPIQATAPFAPQQRQWGVYPPAR